MTERTDPLATFYSSPNEVDRDAFEERSGNLLTTLENRLSQTDKRTLLPASIDNQMRWYGLAPSDRDTRILSEELNAWLGPPLSTALTTANQASDGFDLVVLRLFPDSTILKVEIEEQWQEQAQVNVASLVDTWDLAPARSPDLPRPVGRILRQFYESLIASDRGSAEEALDELKDRALLSPTNIRFLRIELLGRLGTPKEIRDYARLEGILRLVRPPDVTAHLAAAVNALLIEPELTAGPNANWQELGNRIDDEWPNLVTHPDQIRSTFGARCLALTEVLTESPRQAILRVLEETWGDDEVVAAAVRNRVSDQVEVEPQSALDLYLIGEYSRALEVINSSAPSGSNSGLALMSAANLGDAESARLALSIVDQLTDTDRAELLDQAVERNLHTSLQERAGVTDAPSGWVNWLNGEWPDRPDLLKEWATTWGRPTDLEPDESAALEGALLEGLSDQRRDRIRNGLPILTDWLIDENTGLAVGTVPLVAFIVEILLTSAAGRVEREAVLVLLDELLVSGCSSTEYQNLISAIGSQFSQLGPRNAAWLASALDLLLLSAATEPDARDLLVSNALVLAQSWTGLLETTDARLLAKVLKVGGHETSFLTTDTDDKSTRRTSQKSFRRVGIYSLLEPAARRASDWIKELWPSVDVTLSHDHVNSSRLEAMVRGVDVLLIQTSRATHAATSAIGDATAQNTEVIYVNGRGATSIVRGLIEWVES